MTTPSPASLERAKAIATIIEEYHEYASMVDAIALVLDAQIERDAKACQDEKVDADSTREEGDYAYNRACDDCTNAIREQRHE